MNFIYLWFEKNRKVETEEGEKLAKDFQLKFYETSAKTGINVEVTFKDLVQIIDEVSAQNNNLKGGKLTKTTGKKKPCC